MSVLMISGPAQAAVSCYGNLSKALTYSDGRVMVESSWRGDWTTICSLNTPWKDIPTQTCWAWYAAANEAVTQQKKVYVYYPTLNWDQCPHIATYDNAPAPGYVLLEGTP